MPPIVMKNRRLITLVFVLMTMLLTGRAWSQALPFVPEPITTPELMECAEIIGLSDQQAMGLFDLHDQYKERYRTFEDVEVGKLQDKIIDMVTEIMSQGFQIPPRDQLESILRAFERVLARSHAVDDTLFNSLAPLLTEEQTLRLARARQFREMRIYQAVVFEMTREMNRGACVNLSSMVRDLELTPEEFEIVDPMIVQYEQSVLVNTKKVYGLLIDAATIVLDTIDELGIREMSIEDLPRLAEDEGFQADMMNRFNEQSKPFQKAASDLSQLNLRTFHAVIPRLSPGNAAQLRRDFYRRGFRRVYDGAGEWRHLYAAAIRSSKVDDDDKQSLRELRNAYALQDDGMVDSIIRVVEDSRKYRTVMEFAGEQQNEKLLKKISTFREQRESLREQAKTTILGLLGESLIEELKRDPGDGSSGGLMSNVSFDNGSGGSVQIQVEEAESALEEIQMMRDMMHEGFGSPAMSVTDLDSVANLVKWSDDDRDLARTIYDEYHMTYEELRATAMLDVDSDEKPLSPTQQGLLRRERIAALQVLEDQFFSDLEILATDEDAARLLEQARRRRAYEVNGLLSQHMARTWQHEEAFIDIVSITWDMPLAEDMRRQVDDQLLTYASQLEPLAQNRLEHAFEHNRRELATRALFERENVDQRMRERVQERQREEWQAVSRANDKISELNRNTVAEIAASLPADHQWTLQYEYNRIAFPDVFDQFETANRYFDAVLGMQDLTEPQRRSLEEINQQYRTDCYDMGEEVIAMRRARDWGNFDFTQPKREDIEREIKLERMNFDRDELSTRALIRVGLVLTPEQLDRIPDLRRMYDAARSAGNTRGRRGRR